MDKETKTPAVNIQWFPGHMTKAKRQMQEQLRMVDMVIELRDARIPNASKNPLIEELTKQKPRLILLTKRDKAQAELTKRWIEHLQGEQVRVLALDLLKDPLEKRITAAAKEVMRAKLERDRRRGIRPRAIRAMVVGIPNVGKSTLINSLAKRKAAVTGDRPGVTKALQWVKVNKELELLDTPGVLWPKFEDAQVGMLLAVSGAIRDEILPLEEVAYWAMDWLQQHYPSLVEERYGVALCENPYDTLLSIAYKRGYKNGAAIDEKRLVIAFLKEVRDCKIAPITWEEPDED